MKCVIKECNNEASLPFYACSKDHGYIWNKIKHAIENENNPDMPKSFIYPLTEEEKEYYKKLAK